MANIARRLMLQLPICLGEEDHRDRGDGYCNCGIDLSRNATDSKRPVKYATAETPVVRGKSNLDQIEGNWEEYRG